MAAYAMQSDKFFLKCSDIDEGILVSELDDLYMLPVKYEHWNYVDEIKIRPGNKYEALKIGDKEIWGDHLERLTKDLFNSGLMVNREGLCFVVPRADKSFEMELEYYRTLDLYDWSMYGVKTSLKTRWARRDIVEGRPLDIVESLFGDGDGEYNEELKAKEIAWEEDKESYEEVPVEKKYQNEVISLRKKDMQIYRLRQELEKLKRRHQQDLEFKHKVGLEMKNLEEELKLNVFQRSDLSSTSDFFSTMAEKMSSDIPLVKVSVNLDYNCSNWPPSGSPPEIVIPLGSVGPAELSSLPEITLMCSSTDHENMYFECENWRVIKVAVPTLERTIIDYTSLKVELDYTPKRWTMAYYQGGSGFTYVAKSYDQRVSFPCPCLPENMKYFGPLDLKHIVGIGTRLAYFYTANDLPVGCIQEF